MLDVEHLLESLDESEPCGSDPEYTAEFLELEVLARPQEELQVGDAVIEGQDPDYREVREKALEVLRSSKDLRAAVFLSEAALRLDGFPAFAEVLDYIHGCLDRFWESCHPQLDPDDGDPTMRVNAVVGLVGSDSVLRAVRLAPLTRSRVFGRVCLRDIQIMRGEVAAPVNGDPPKPASEIDAAFADTDGEILQEIAAAVDRARTRVTAIEALFTDQIGAQGPDLSLLSKLLREVESALTQHGGEAGQAVSGDNAPADDADGEGAAAPVRGGAAVRSAVGSIAGPEDVKRVLDSICEYYASNEPSSPLPLLLKRARRLVSADFQTIIRDMAPQGMENVELVAGLETEDED